jgi:hypothetical protein
LIHLGGFGDVFIATVDFGAQASLDKVAAFNESIAEANNTVVVKSSLK